MEGINGIFDYRLPHPALREYVRLLQIIGYTFPSHIGSVPAKAYWPRAENCLSFFPKDAEQIEYGFDGKLIPAPKSRLYGQHSVATSRHVAGHDFLVFQVQFQPGALSRLTGLPLHELTNTSIDAEAVFSKEIRAVNERLSYTNHYMEMVPIVEDFLFYLVGRQLSSRYKNNLLPIDKAAGLLIAQRGNMSLDWLAQQTCVSQRQFYRQFVERHGVSPKLYARIARFEDAIRLKNAAPHKDWLTIALELGYHDYQHLVRDFKEFTTLTPNEFWAAENKSPERSFGAVET
ncbi:MAG: helix-turn-helix domain-containing protein [Runella sp.]